MLIPLEMLCDGWEMGLRIGRDRMENSAGQRPDSSVDLRRLVLGAPAVLWKQFAVTVVLSLDITYGCQGQVSDLLNEEHPALPRSGLPLSAIRRLSRYGVPVV